MTKYNRGVTGLISSTANNTTSYYYTDYHGNVTQFGTTAYDYDAFGNQTTTSNNANPFRYCGEYYDAETGLIYLRARYYDSAVGAFVSEDPIKDGLNWYAYCGADPVMFVDYSGLVAFEYFDTLDELAKDWAWNYYPLTDYTGLEYGSLIIGEMGADNKVRYYYTWSVIGEPHSCDPWEMYKDFEDDVIVGVIHSHPNATDFSDSDVAGSAKKDTVSVIYVVVPEKERDSSSYNIRKSVKGDDWQHGKVPQSYFLKQYGENYTVYTPRLSAQRQQEIKSNLKINHIWERHDPKRCKTCNGREKFKY